MKFNTSKIKVEEVTSWALIFLSTSLLAYSTKCGLGLTHDSLTYLEGGSVLYKGGHFMDASYPKNIVPNGPLLPLILSLFGNDAFRLYGLLSLVYLLATLFCFKYLIFSITNNTYVKIWTIAAISFGTSLFMVYNFLWTESAFIALLAISMVYLYKYVESAKEKYLVYLGIIGFILTSLRMAGILFPIVIFGMLYLLNKDLLKRPWYLFSFLLSIMGFILWRVYIAGYEGGVEKLTPPEEVIHLYKFQIDYLSSLGLWFLPGFIHENIRAVFSLAFLVSASLFVYFKRKDVEPGRNAMIKILMAGIIVYYLARSILERDLDQIDRYLSEIYPLSFLVIGVIADAYIVHLTRVKKTVLLLLLFLWLLYPVGRTVKNVAFWKQKFCTENAARLR